MDNRKARAVALYAAIELLTAERDNPTDLTSGWSGSEMIETAVDDLVKSLHTRARRQFSDWKSLLFRCRQARGDALKMNFREMPDEELSRWIAVKRGWIVEQFSATEKYGWMKIAPGENRDRSNYRTEAEAWEDGPHFCDDMNDAIRLLAEIPHATFEHYPDSEFGNAWCVLSAINFTDGSWGVPTEIASHDKAARAIAEAWVYWKVTTDKAKRGR
jgi:hypothetical protein